MIDVCRLCPTHNRRFRLTAMKFATSCLIVLLLGATSNFSSAGETPLFDDDSIMKAVLTAPISQAYAQKNQDVRIYFPGQWSYTDSEGENQRLDVSIRTRGNFRREYCVLPPLQLNFKKSQVGGTEFAGQNKLKLVSPCKPDDHYQEKVVLEYLAYRTLEILTDHSFKTRLVRLSYVDSDQKKTPWTSLGFVIEDDSDVADRLGLQKIHVPEVGFQELDRARTATAELFMFLIANYDYSVIKAPKDEDCCHNVEVMVPDDADGGVIPIPYDFDMSGLVHARYAAPPKNLPIKSVRTRYYKGLCQPPETIATAVDHVRSKQAEVIALYTSTNELESKPKERAIAYIEDFFEILNSAKRVEREIINRCRGQSLLDAMH
jgi:hypothetical protein